MASDNEINQLKAQVNCLREALDNVLTVEDVTVDVAITIANALKSSPEHCLAEVKAKVIEDVASNIQHFDMGIQVVSKLRTIAKQLREQAK